MHSVDPEVVVPLNDWVLLFAIELGAKIEPLVQLAESRKMVEPYEFVIVNCAEIDCADAPLIPAIESSDAANTLRNIFVFFVGSPFSSAFFALTGADGDVAEGDRAAVHWRGAVPPMLVQCLGLTDHSLIGWHL